MVNLCPARVSASFSTTSPVDSPLEWVGTHDGSFHCDKALGCFMICITANSQMLKLCAPGTPSVSSSVREEENIGGLSALKNVGKPTKDGDLGTATSPIHMVTTGGDFKEQLWHTIRSIAVAFLWISGLGALIEDKGICKGLGINEETQPSME